MASIIPGYEYDIFISYRQKDNKHDGWVTEFVNNLKGELGSTFKEEISVYFDINPHDGLLETHDVNASLKEKLKCLVFIPIISQTYCDSKSFAWQHELVAFNKLAKEDQFGRDIRLAGGNVASRILPVKIHDLDTEDKSLLENELGGVLRAIEFIYKASGVNRPLKPKDERAENLNHTYYPDQINKVANSIKEIITAIKKPNHQDRGISREVSKPKPESPKKLKPKIIIASLLVLVLLALGYLFIPKLSKSSEPVEKSIAVLPFKLLSDEPDKQYLADGMMEAILLNLSKIKDLRVMPSTSVEQFRVTTKTTKQIGKELGVEYLLEGRFQKDGNNVRLIVKLIKASEESYAWADQYNRNWNDVFSVQSQIAQTIATKLKAIMTPEEKQLIEKPPTANLTAYDFYQRGRDEYTKYSINNNNIAALQKAEGLFHNALKYDSTFAQAYSGLALIFVNRYTLNIYSYFTENYLDSAMILVNQALSYDDQFAEAYDVRAQYYYLTGNVDKAIKELDKALMYNPNYWEAYRDMGYVYLSFSDNMDFVKSLENQHKAVNLNRGREFTSLLRYLGSTYLSTAGFIEKGNFYIQEAFKLDSDSISYFNNLSEARTALGDYKAAIEYANKAYAMDSNNISTLIEVGFNYLLLGQYDESLKYYKKYAEKSEKIGQLKLSNMHRIGFVYWQNGHKEKAKYYFNEQKKYCEESIKLRREYALDLSAYYDLAGVFAFLGDKEKAYENLKIWTKLPVCPLWMVTLINNDPLFNSLRDQPEFEQIMKDQEAKYQAEHERVRKWMVENGML